MISTDLFETTWGSIRLWCSSITTSAPRTQVTYELSTVTSPDEHPTTDRGPGVEKITCSLLFDQMPRDPTPPLDRFKAFIAQKNRGDVELFTHPIEGSFPVRIGEFTYQIDEDSNVVDATAEFIVAGEMQPVIAARTALASTTGTDSVSARAEVLSGLLDDLDLLEDGPTVADQAVTAVESWSESDEIPTRDILNDAANVSSGIDALIQDLGLEDDLALWPTYQAAILLQETFRSSALAATSETDSLFFLKVNSPTSVLALVTRIYGGVEADMRDRQVRSLNVIDAPGGMIRSGTELAMPSQSTLRNFATQRAL